MKLLVEEMSTICRTDRKEARSMADALVRFISRKVHNGEPIHFGCISVIPKKRKASVVKSHLERTGKTVYYIGDQVKWVVSVSKGWQRDTKPDWSKYC